jgi:hypothetical protein
VGGAVLGDLLSEEVRTRLDRVPAYLLELAARRVDADLRVELLEEWSGELHEILRGAEALPVTRLWRGLRYSAGLLVAAPRVGRILGRLIRQRRENPAIFVESGAEGLYLALLQIRVTVSHPAWQAVLRQAGLRPLVPGRPYSKEEVKKAVTVLRANGFIDSRVPVLSVLEDLIAQAFLDDVS